MYLIKMYSICSSYLYKLLYEPTSTSINVTFQIYKYTYINVIKLKFNLFNLPNNLSSCEKYDFDINFKYIFINTKDNLSRYYTYVYKNDQNQIPIFEVQ